MTLDYLYYVTLLLFCFSSLYKISFYTYLFQKKDYKRKRIIMHFFSTNEGRGLYLSFFFFAEIFLIVWYFAGIFFSFFFYGVFMFFIIYFMFILKNLLQRNFYFPVITIKTIAIGVSSFLIIIVLSLIPLVDRFFWLIFLHSTIFITVSFFVFVFSLSTDFLKDIVINRAIKKISIQKGLSVIAVTGSFGKTTTKEMLDFVLREKFNTFKNSDSHNTPYGVAITIEKLLNRRKQIFISEINLKNKDDHRDFSQIISPNILVFSGLDTKATSLAKNVDEIVSWYHDLARNTTYNSLLLINEENIFLSKLFRRSRNLKHKKIFYGFSENSDIRALDVKVSKFKTAFSLSIFGKKYGTFQINMLGRYSVSNILPAIFLGQKYGLNKTQITDIIDKIRPLKHKMQPFLTAEKVILIDDTDGASPTAVFKAIEYMRVFKRKKILVLEPIIELGRMDKQIHKEIGEACAGVLDEIYITNTNFIKDIRRGIGSVLGKTTVKYLAPSGIAKRLKNLSPEDAVLFEGEEARSIMGLISSDSIY